jgi:hypothetical protein
VIFRHRFNKFLKYKLQIFIFGVFNSSRFRRSAAFRLEESLGRSRIFTEQICRSDWTTHEITAAVRADAVEFRFHAIAAKRAFKSANHRLGRRDRQIPITAFAIRL